MSESTPDRSQASTLQRVAGVLLIIGLLAEPAASHLYWTLGGTWGLRRSVGGHIEESTTTGIRVVAAIVLVLVAAAVLVVLARVGLWEQAIVSDCVIRFFAWALAAFFLLETLAAFTWDRGSERWLYGPASLVLGLLALVVASSAGLPRSGQKRETLPAH